MEFFDFTNLAQTLSTLITNDHYYTYYWVCLIIGGVAFLSLFAMQAVALYTIAKNNGYKNRWMAFVPFLNTYYIGVLAKKNNTFNTKTKYFSLALAIVEVISAVVGILYAVAVIQLFSTDYLTAVPEPVYNSAHEIIATVFSGKYEVSDQLPQSLYWALWVFENANKYLFTVLDLIYIVLSVFVLSAFFRSYSPRNYMIFTIISVILPVKGLFMLCVKNKKEVNYVDYVKEMQKRRYDAYQEYMRNSGGYGNGGYNNGGYGNGANNAGYNNAGQGQASHAEDPFDGLGQQPNKGNNSPDDDPFDDLK